MAEKDRGRSLAEKGRGPIALGSSIVAAALLASVLLLGASPAHGNAPAEEAPGYAFPFDSDVPQTRTGEVAGVALHPWRMGADDPTPLPVWPLDDPRLRELVFAKLESLGIRQARVDMRWYEVEPRLKGLRDWAEFDAIHAAARAHRVALLPIVAMPPEWANGNGGPWTYPVRPKDFEDFMAAALNRYPDIRAWEIWNEPNLPLFSTPKVDSAKFVELLVAAARARDRVASPAKIVSGGLSQAGVDPFKFFEEMIRHGAFDHVDGFGIHPYTPSPPGSRHSFFLKLPRFHKRLVEIGRPHVRLWLTEFGAPHSTQDNNYGPAFDEHEQAARLRSAFTIASRWPWVANVTWYEMQDNCADPANAECNFGLIRLDFSEKPSYAAMKELLDGPLPRIASRITLGRVKASAGKKSRAKSRKTGRPRGRRRAPQFPVGGAVETAGAEGNVGSVRLELAWSRRRNGPFRRVRTLRLRIKDGRYATVLKRPRKGHWRLVATYSGSGSHEAAASPPLVLRVKR